MHGSKYGYWTNIGTELKAPGHFFAGFSTAYSQLKSMNLLL